MRCKRRVVVPLVLRACLCSVFRFRLENRRCFWTPAKSFLATRVKCVDTCAGLGNGVPGCEAEGGDTGD